MRKFYSFVLLAVGLLIGTNARGAGDVTAADDDAAVAAGAVAKIGDQYYSTFALAVTDANATTNATITLLQEEVAFASATLSKAMTLDLNGKTLKYNTKSKTITISAAVTISIQNGTLSDGGVAVSNGLITMAKDKAILNLTNVHLSCPTGGYPIYTTTATPTININEGTTLEGKSGLCYFIINTKVNNKVALEGVINAVGNKTITWTNIDGGSLTLTGGYVPATMIGYTLASGKKTINTYHATYLASKQIVADDAEIVATMANGDVTYEYVSMATAIPAAKVGSKTIVMQRDADLTAAATMVAGSTLDLGGFTLRPTTAACSLTCNTQNGAYTIKSGKIDAGEIKPTQLISIASKTGISLNLEDVDLVNKGTYDVYSTIGSSTLNFDAATTFTKGVYAKVTNSTTSPLTIIPPTGQENDYVMTNVAAGGWRMVKIADAKFTVTDGENTTYHSVFGEALYDAKLATGKTLKMLDDVTLTAATTLHNGTLDMNEHAISINGNVGITCCPADNAEVTIKNGTISTTATKTAAALLVNTKTGAQVSLQNVKVSASSYYPIQLNTASKSNTLTIDADCELTGKTYAIYVYEACTPTINNYATLTQNIYATADPSLTINNYGTIPGISFSRANAKNHITNNYAGGAIVFNPNQTLSGQVTLHNEGTLDIQKIVSNMVITGNGTFKLVSGSYVNIDLPAATYVDLAEGTIIRAEDLQDVGAAPEGLKWLNPTMYGGIAACKLVKADAETVCKIGDYEYISLADAVAAVPTDGTETQITMVADATISSKVTIANTKNVVLELNGKVIRLGDGCSGTMIDNNGTLTVQDNTDYLVPVLDAISLQSMEGIQQFRGNGTGKITCSYSNPDLSGNPSVTSNAISNGGTLYVKSGWIENLSDGSASFAIDNKNTAPGKVYISGGKISSSQSNSIRMFNPNNQSIEITGGEIYRIWVQDGTSASAVASLSITNATLTQGLLVGHSNKIENFTLTLDNCIVGDYILYELPAVETNVLSFNKCKSGALYMVNPRPILTNGLFSFTKPYNAGWAWIETFAEKYPASEGWSMGTNVWYDKDTEAYIEGESCDYCEYAEAWLTPDWLLHFFYGYIADGYGLVARPDVGAGWYEVAKAQNTTGEESDIYGELGNPWHEDKTWDLTEDGVVPQEGDAVLIDHDVYVELGTKAVASSIQIESGQTLTVESGATLQILDAGALFKDETAKLVVEPDAVVTVGANGVIADSENNIVIESTETEQGIFIISPDVAINTQPHATVQLYTKCKQINNNPYEYVWQRFAIPTEDGKNTIYADNHETIGSVLFNGENSYVDAVYGWNDSQQDWYMLSRWKDMEPYKGYQLTNNTADGGVTYTFKGNLVGNNNGEFAFSVQGFHFFGNSYTAPIYIKTFLDSIAADNNGVEQSLWIYDVDADNFKSVTKLMAGKIKYKNGKTIDEIRSMQAFIMKTNNASAQSTVDYASAIWGNPRYKNAALTAERQESVSYDMATIKVVADNGQADEVHLFQGSEFTDNFEDGADASKYMYEQGINLYANTANGPLSDVATGDINATELSFVAGASTQYTISFDDLNGETFTLVDNVTGIHVSMVPGATYTFVQNAYSTIEGRFSINAVHRIITNIEDAQSQVSISKVIENGQLIVVKDGKRYSAVGQLIK